MFSNVRDKSIVALHRAKNSKDLSLALFGLFSELVPNHLQVLVLRPNTLATEVFCSRAECLLWYENGIKKTLTEELLVDYGLETPIQVFSQKAKSLSGKSSKLSSIHKDFMVKAGTEHAASLIVGRPHGWQACLTIWRTREQGPFTEEQLNLLQLFRLYLQSTIERVLGQGEGDLCRKALETFIWIFPSAVIVLNWNLKVLYFNASAMELSECWKLGQAYIHTKKAKVFTLPDELLSTIQKEKALLPFREVNSKGSHKALLLSELRHPLLPGLVAKTYFHPNHSLTMSEGTFLINLYRQNPVPDTQQVYDSILCLSPRERDVVQLAAQGKKSNEIATQLGTAPITVRMQLYSAYKKLGIKTRYELMNLFSHRAFDADKKGKKGEGPEKTHFSKKNDSDTKEATLKLSKNQSFSLP